MAEIHIPLAYRAFCRIYNQFKPLPAASRAAAALPALREVEERALSRRTCISDHLVTIFAETLVVRPKLIVEFGVGDGESTFALERAARLSDAHLLDVDIDDCAAASAYPKRFFVQREDVAFAHEFPAWCAAHGLAPVIDVLFLDTDHLYQHTREELRAWVPFVAEHGKLLLHDTNLRRFYRRRDGSLGVGWNNRRGVIRAVKEMVGLELDERHDFVAVTAGWIIRHWAHCNGLTVLERY
jgi:cephalosporin hydroxylase